MKSALGWFIPYALSVLLTKGMAIVTIPLITGYLPPEEYGRLELVASVIEVAAIVLSFAIGDVLFRLAATSDPAEAKRQAAAIAGGALALAIVVGASLQIALWTLAPAQGFVVDRALLSLGLLSASLSGLIAFPLAWQRCRGAPRMFLAFVAGRSILQTTCMAITLPLGWGATGLLMGNAVVDVALVATLMTLQARDTGVSFDVEVLRRALRYGAPLVGAALAMFVLGACDRWFLIGAVDAATLAHYGLAMKLAMVVALAVQPFGLWWYARRIRVLGEADGLRRSADAVAVGFALLAMGAIAVALAGPALIARLLPAGYAAAGDYVAWLVLIVVMNEACSLLNVGSYVGRSGAAPLVVNAAGAVVALIGYILFVPRYGVEGAIGATIAGHAVRLVLFVAYGRKRAPAPYRYGLICIMAAIATGAVINAPPHDDILATVALMIGACAAVAVSTAIVLLRERLPVSALFAPALVAVATRRAGRDK